MRQVVIYAGEDGYWVAECPSLPGCVSQGRTKEEAIANIREAIAAHIHALEEDYLPVTEDKLDVKPSSELLDTITRLLVQEFAPEQIYLFGSHAWGEPTPDSDFDILVIVSESDQRPIDRAIRARRRLRDVPAAIDVLVKTRAEVERYRHVRASLMAAITERGKVLYG